MKEVSPRKVLGQIAQAIPADCQGNIIVVGSLAAGYYFFGNDSGIQVRTKDIDCVLSPRIVAAEKGTRVAQKLLDAHWKPRTEGDHGVAGNASTPTEQLPAVRLFPPDSEEWFIELLSVPDDKYSSAGRWTRLELSAGHYGLPAFEYLRVATFKSIPTNMGISIAQPRLMALANLLEHPEIRPEKMKGLIEGRQIKRSNKDLGRAVAIARLATDGEEWCSIWEEACKDCLSESWPNVCSLVGSGVRALLKSDGDLEEALWTCNNGLLSSKQLNATQFRASAERLLVDAIEPFEKLSQP